ncbi:DUF2897 family protein [Thalassotalea sp. PP2-459]|uniref:DUF2897 family protein n=1 Tax=Thalassotalea sp. PP2-459 TaxID=1742724 RepID=UPI0009F89535|nr:DUF2897 family protein [Thalassotalea sp. PP2-459]
MNIYSYLLIFLCLAFIVGAVMVIFQSARKFKLTDEQRKNIKIREAEQRKKDKQEE